MVTAQGWLWVDGTRVYNATDLGLRIISGPVFRDLVRMDIRTVLLQGPARGEIRTGHDYSRLSGVCRGISGAFRAQRIFIAGKKSIHLTPSAPFLRLVCLATIWNPRHGAG